VSNAPDLPRGASRARAFAIALLVGCTPACEGCDPGRSSVGDAFTALQRHRAAFMELDRWARRAMQGAELIKGERALAETVFVKARAERSVAGAWIQQAGPPPLAMALPAAAPPPAMSDAQRLRDPDLGLLELRLAAPCPGKDAPTAAPGATPTDAPVRCVIVARSAEGPRGALRVVVAFRD
jgi:hypothetical protein